MYERIVLGSGIVEIRDKNGVVSHVITIDSGATITPPSKKIGFQSGYETIIGFGKSNIDINLIPIKLNDVSILFKHKDELSIECYCNSMIITFGENSPVIAIIQSDDIFTVTMNQ